jgi:hypothetical protein
LEVSTHSTCWLPLLPHSLQQILTGWFIILSAVGKIYGLKTSSRATIRPYFEFERQNLKNSFYTAKIYTETQKIAPILSYLYNNCLKIFFDRNPNYLNIRKLIISQHSIIYNFLAMGQRKPSDKENHRNPSTATIFISSRSVTIVFLMLT